jgi:hypothetical protein
VRQRIRCGLAVLALVIAAPSGEALAASLTRSKCWNVSFDNGSKRALCFFSASRVKMTNSNRTADGASWSTCNFSGDYVERGASVTITFAPHSGKCTNGASSPEFTAVCDFSGDSLPCRGSSIVDGKTYEFNGTFN